MKLRNLYKKVLLFAAPTVFLLAALFVAVNYLQTKKQIPTKSSASEEDVSSLTPVTRKIQLLVFNPILTTKGGRTLIAYEGWGSPTAISNQVISDLNSASRGYVNYKIVQIVTINAIPTLADGFSYTEKSYLNCLSNSTLCHKPYTVNYRKILLEYDSCSKLNGGAIDEVWLWGGPYFGYWESTLAGPNAFSYNSPPVTGTGCKKLLPIMGFNYERGEAEALHSYGHRVEATMSKVYGGWQKNTKTPWNTFSLYDLVAPKKARCGDVHFPPNGRADYDYTNKLIVQSACDDWLKYPNLPEEPVFKNINCLTWGCTQDGYLKWWFKHIPRASGSANNILNNWWVYIANPNRAI